MVDLGNNHFDVYLLDLYAPYDYSFFEIHPTSGGEIIDHLYIDVAGPPAGSPVVVRVLPSCDNPDLKIDTVYNILETADGEHLLNRVEVDGDVGLVMVEAIGDILLGGDVIGDRPGRRPSGALASDGRSRNLDRMGYASGRDSDHDDRNRKPQHRARWLPTL